jgi:DNA-3-methyladenine glycosylase II
MRLRITPVSPFDFPLSATIFSGGDPQIRTFEHGKYWQVIRLNNNLMFVTVASVGTVDNPQLAVEVTSNEAIATNDKKQIEETVHSIFNLHFDLTAFYDEVKADTVMAILIQQLKGLKSPTTPTVFEALVDSIIEQQIALTVAHSLERNVIETFGDNLTLDDAVYYAYPTPQNIANGTVEQLRNCGLSMRKAEYIHGIATSIVQGELDLEQFKSYDDPEEIIKEMVKIRGIGVWTAELTMLRGMHKLDAIPADDLGLRRHIAHYYCNDRKITGAEAREIAEKWGTWKGLAAYYLILASRLGMEP